MWQCFGCSGRAVSREALHCLRFHAPCSIEPEPPAVTPCSPSLLAAARTDNDWHHLAVSWAYESGAVKLYIDGQEKPAFWVSRGGSIEASRNGVRCEVGSNP